MARYWARSWTPYSVTRSGTPQKRLARSPGRAARPPEAAWAEVDRAERVVAVPVEGERAQGAFEEAREGEVVGDPGGAHGAVRAGRAAGGLQNADGRLGAQLTGEPAVLAGEGGESVQPLGEAVAAWRPGWRGLGADRGGQASEVARRTPGVHAVRSRAPHRAPGAGGGARRGACGGAVAPGTPAGAERAGPALRLLAPPPSAYMSNSCRASPRTSRSHHRPVSPVGYGYPPSVSSPIRMCAPPISLVGGHRWQRRLAAGRT